MATKAPKNFWSEIQYFTKQEWQNDPDKAAIPLIKLADRIRTETKKLVKGGIPMIIHVCWAGGGHSDGSFHYSGQAVDFHFHGKGQKLLDEAMFLMSFPEIGGIGIYPDWKPRPGWHIDIRSASPRVLWTYMSGTYVTTVEGFVDGIGKAKAVTGR